MLFNCFSQNGHSLEKLAMHTGNQEIIDILERSRNVVRQEPFIDVLSGYFDKKVQEESAKRDAKVCVLTCDTL